MKHRKFIDEQQQEVTNKEKLNQKERKSKQSVTSNMNKMTSEQLQQQLLGNSYMKFHSFSMLEQQLLQQLEMDCKLSGKATLWQQLSNLSEGQQRAFLADLYKLSEDSYDIPGEHDWAKWEKYLNRLSQLPFDKEEAYKEVRKNDESTNDQFFDMRVEEFTSPYREIWLWLNYKGNHQNHIDILRRLEQLPIDRKKWFMHKVINGKKVNAQTFTTELTIVVHEQTLVDWERIINCLDELEQKSEQDVIDELDDFKDNETNSNNEASMLPNKEKLEPNQSDLTLSPFLLLGLLGDDNKKEGKVTTEYISIIIEWCKSAEQLSILLFSKGLDDKSKINIGMDVLTFVDKILMISTAAKEETRRVKREQLLKKYGFVSPIVFASYCIEKITATIYEQGVEKREPKYKKLLIKLGYQNDALPSQEQLLKKMYAIYLGY